METKELLSNAMTWIDSIPSAKNNEWSTCAQMATSYALIAIAQELQAMNEAKAILSLPDPECTCRVKAEPGPLHNKDCPLYCPF